VPRALGEREFSEHSYGFRPERNARQAVERVERLLHEGYGWVVDADLKGYFDSIPHEKLLDGVRGGWGSRRRSRAGSR